MITKIDNNTLVITTDNAGSIGEKELDSVSVPYEVLSYYTTRNAVMDNLSQNTKLSAVIFQNFCGDEAYDALLRGIDLVLGEFDYEVPITSSTESNFKMQESAFGIVVIGEKLEDYKSRYSNYAVVGKPLIGDEVVKHPEEIVSIKEFMLLLNHESVSYISTVGSKGIKVRAKNVFDIDVESKDIDLCKSAGPSTCVLIEYQNLDALPKEIQKKLTKLKGAVKK